MAFIEYVGDRMFFDAIRSVVLGRALDSGAASISTHVENTKTFLGPMLAFQVYSFGGLAAMRAVAIAGFMLLGWLQYSMGIRFFGGRVTAFAVFLSAFYIGTNKTVVAGEIDDVVASVLFLAAVWVYLRLRSDFAAGVVAGLAFLFKFWVAILCVGFVVHLLLNRKPTEAPAAVAGMAAPFLVVNLVDDWASLHALLFSAQRQEGFSSLRELLFKLFSTGLLPAALAAAWSWRKLGGEQRGLFAAIQIAYLAYVLVMRDAYAAGYVMVACLPFSSFLVAELALDRLRSSRTLIGFGVCYLVLTTALTHHNLYRDTRPFDVDEFERTKTPLDSFLLPGVEFDP